MTKIEEPDPEEIPDPEEMGTWVHQQPGPVRLVSNAVPGKPDGEVDTRP